MLPHRAGAGSRRAIARGIVLLGGNGGAMIFGAGMWSEWYSSDPAVKDAASLWAWLDRVLIEPHYDEVGRLIWQCPAASPGAIVLGIPSRGAALVLPGWEELATGELCYVLNERCLTWRARTCPAAGTNI